MIRINLLPHRQEKRRAIRQQFYALTGLCAVLAATVVLAGHLWIDRDVVHQEGKNAFLKQEIGALDKEIEEIKRLKEQTQALIARKQIIESLQQDRAEAVHILAELTRHVPEGIYLKNIKQDGPRINLIGYAQSNARVSTLMRNIESSAWLERPQLIEIKAVTHDKRRMSEFSLNLYVVRAAKADAGGAAGAKK